GYSASRTIRRVPHLNSAQSDREGVSVFLRKITILLSKQSLFNTNDVAICAHRCRHLGGFGTCTPTPNREGHRSQSPAKLRGRSPGVVDFLLFSASPPRNCHLCQNPKHCLVTVHSNDSLLPDLSSQHLHLLRA